MFHSLQRLSRWLYFLRLPEIQLLAVFPKTTRGPPSVAAADTRSAAAADARLVAAADTRSVAAADARLVAAADARSVAAVSVAAALKDKPVLQGQTIVAVVSGGNVDMGKSYLVGERGPELFMPQASGSIVPNNQLAQAPQVNIRNVNAFDTAVVGDYMGSSDGEQIIMNVVT